MTRARWRASLVLGVAAAVLAGLPCGADTYPRQPGVDATHYVFKLSLGDAGDEIDGEAEVRLRIVTDGVREVFLDLASPAGGKGMTVQSASSAGKPVAFTHKDDRLRLPLASPSLAGDELGFTIRYGGIPADGLRLIKNIHGERTVFSENWPNKARQWLPMIDHPYDKATGELIVTAPAHYQVVSNGLLFEELDLGNGLRRTHWKQSVPISSWLYALGVARFAVHHAGLVKGVPLETWVFPQDREKGYPMFEPVARNAMEFFSERIGIGTEAFWSGIREYYRLHQNQNASTDELRHVMERVSGQDLGWFFRQWLTRSGVPRVEGSWRYDAAAKQVVVSLAQTQAEPYRLSIEIGVQAAGQAAPRVERVELTDPGQTFRFASDGAPTSVELDPQTWLLMDAGPFTRRSER